MARITQLEEFARAHDLKIISIADLISYRVKHEKLSSAFPPPGCRPGTVSSPPTGTRTS
jgi:hypothetical protein